MPSTGGSRSGSGGDDTGHGSGRGGMGGGSARGGSGGNAMTGFPGGVGPSGPAGYGGYGTYDKSYGAGKAYGGAGASERRATTKFGKFSQALFGYKAAPPYLDPKTVKPKDAVTEYMDYLTERRGIWGRVKPTGPGVATDIGLNILGGVSGAPLAPAPAIGGVAVGVNIVNNYREDKEKAIGKLSAAGYSMPDIENSFKDYEAGLVEGLEGFGAGDSKNELNDYEKALAEGLRAEADGGGDMKKTSTSQASNVEEMRTARRKKTKRIFGGQLGSTDSGNQVKRAKLLGQ